MSSSFERFIVTWSVLRVTRVSRRRLRVTWRTRFKSCAFERTAPEFQQHTWWTNTFINWTVTIRSTHNIPFVTFEMHEWSRPIKSDTSSYWTEECLIHFYAYWYIAHESMSRHLIFTWLMSLQKFSHSVLDRTPNGVRAFDYDRRSESLRPSGFQRVSVQRWKRISRRSENDNRSIYVTCFSQEHMSIS